jgi:hypothetical protein
MVRPWPNDLTVRHMDLIRLLRRLAMKAVEGRLMTVSALAMTKLSNRLVVTQRPDDGLAAATGVDVGPQVPV